MTSSTGIMRILIVSLVIFVSFNAARAQPDSIYRLPAGTRMKLMLDADLSSRSAGVNDTFLASLSEALTVRNAVVLPAGTMIEGRVTEARPARSGHAGKLELVFESLMFSSEKRRPIDAVLVTELRARRSGSFSVLSILGGTAAGAAVGGLTRSGIGAALGAGIGAGIGTGIVFARKGPEIKIERNTEFEIVLRKEVVLPVLDY